jgi:hypothetical protein
VRITPLGGSGLVARWSRWRDVLPLCSFPVQAEGKRQEQVVRRSRATRRTVD